MYHPWRTLRDLPDWLVGWAHLDGDLQGVCHHGARTIVLDSRLTQAERRCTLSHELVHRSRGPVPTDPVLAAREEAAVEREASRLLIPLDLLLDAARWSTDIGEMAEHCWVDVPMMTARLRGLHPAERAALKRAVEHHG